MNKVTVRDLRNRGGQVLERVARGETLTVTVSGRAVAELRPLPARGLRAEALLDRWSRLPRVEPRKLRADLDEVLDATI
jgi:prevent-host-death family protein